MNSPLTAALAYAARGWRVVPIGAGQKHPDLPAWQDAASTDPDVIARWYQERPARGVGIATGNGLLVVDVDVNWPKVGVDSLAELEGMYGTLPDTVEAITGSGGCHLYFTYPPELRLGNSAGRLGPDLDIRADGGQVVAPPTLHAATGQPYCWDLAHHPDDTAVAAAPAWLLELLREPERNQSTEHGPPTGPPVLATEAYDSHPNAQAHVEGLLTAQGWARHHVDRQGVIHLTRPGKDIRDGTSATLGALEKPGSLRCFTSSWPPLEAERSYDPSAVLRLLYFDGDPAAADRWLVDAGWGVSSFGSDLRPLGDISHPICPPAPDGFFVDWGTFLGKDRPTEDWLLEPLLARGRAHSFYAGHKTGKSLMLLWAAAKLATGDDPVVVIYLDYEMSEDDLQERVEDMGYGPESDLSRLRYALLPMLAPLDSPDGGDALLEIVDAEQARWPDHHIAVIIDTTSRAVSGEENSADTIRAFYRETGIKLKQRGCTWVRVDHAGKDAAKGQRGSSAKGDDVDVVWLVSPGDGGSLLLQRKAARMGWVPETVALARTEGPLAYSTGAGKGYPPRTKECSEALDKLAAPLDIGRRAATPLLKAAGHAFAAKVIDAALRSRREPRPLTPLSVLAGPGTHSEAPVSGSAGPRV